MSSPGSRGPSCNALYSTDKNRARFYPRDQTHKLCDDCLKQWVDEGGTIDNKLTKEDPILTEAEQNRRRAKAASGSRRREAQLIGRHSSQGDKKLILTATHAGGALKPTMCANMHAIWEMGKENPNDPKLKRIVTNVNQIVNLWEEIAKLIKDVKTKSNSSTPGGIAGEPSSSAPGETAAITGTNDAGATDTINGQGGQQPTEQGHTASASQGQKRDLTDCTQDYRAPPRAKIIRVCGQPSKVTE